MAMGFSFTARATRRVVGATFARLDWHSGAVGGSAKSALAAEGGTALGEGELDARSRQLLAEACNPEKPPREIDDLSPELLAEIYSDIKGFVARVHSDVGHSTDKRFRFVASMTEESVRPNRAACLSWNPTWATVADAFTEGMGARVLLSFFGAREHNCGTSKPNTAMLASALQTCDCKVKGQPTPSPSPDVTASRVSW